MAKITISLIKADVGGYPGHSSVRPALNGLELLLIIGLVIILIPDETEMLSLKEIQTRLAENEKRIYELERWIYKMIGASIAIGFLITISVALLNALA